MNDRIYYGVAETGTWQTASPTPHIDLDGGVPAGVAIVQRFNQALVSGDVVTVTVRKDADNWACYGYESGSGASSGPEFTSGSPDILDFSAADLRDSKGALANGDPVEVWVELPEPDPAMEEPADDDIPKLRKTDGTQISEWVDAGNAALRDVGTGAGDVAQGDAPGAVQTNLDTHKTSADHDARYYTKTQQDVTDGNQNTAIAGKFGTGDTVDHWFDKTQEGSAAAYAATDGQTVIVSLTSSGTINLTTPVVSSGTAINFGLVIIPGPYTPTIQINGSAPSYSPTLPTWAGGNAYSFNALVANGQSFLMGGQELD